MEQNKTTKQEKMATPLTSPVKPLNIMVLIGRPPKKNETFVTVTLSDPDSAKNVITETFPMLPNVPLESYIQFTFGKYNALCSNNAENA